MFWWDGLPASDRVLASGNHYLLIPFAFWSGLQSTAAAIKAIRESGMNLNPEVDGIIIRVPVPKWVIIMTVCLNSGICEMMEWAAVGIICDLGCVYSGGYACMVTVRSWHRHFPYGCICSLKTPQAFKKYLIEPLPSVRPGVPAKSPALQYPNFWYVGLCLIGFQFLPAQKVAGQWVAAAFTKASEAVARHL